MFGGIRQVEIRDKDQREIELRNGLDGANVDCDPVESGHSVWLAAVIDDRNAQVNSGADRIKVCVENIKGIYQHLKEEK